MPDSSAERFYLEASRGTSEIIEHTATDSTERSAVLTLGPPGQLPWRISVRAFNAAGLSPGRSAVLTKGIAPPNTCPAGALPVPTLVSAQAAGRTLFMQWQPNPLCPTAVTGFTILGQYDPHGPVIGTIDVYYPSGRSWSGVVPPAVTTSR